LNTVKNRKGPGQLRARACVIALGLLALAGTACAEEVKPVAKSWQTGLHRTDLIQRDLGVADREVVQVRVDFDPGVVSPKHSHPGVEVAYVISGTFEYQLEGQPNVILKSGDSLYIPEGTVHVATNIGSTTGSELATYIVKKNTPLVILSK